MVSDHLHNNGADGRADSEGGLIDLTGLADGRERQLRCKAEPFKAHCTLHACMGFSPALLPPRQVPSENAVSPLSGPAKRGSRKVVPSHQLASSDGAALLLRTQSKQNRRRTQRCRRTIGALTTISSAGHLTACSVLAPFDSPGLLPVPAWKRHSTCLPGG